MTSTGRLYGPPASGGPTCAFSSPVHPAGSARRSCPNCSPPGTTSSAWPVPIARPTPSPVSAPKSIAAASTTSATLRSGAEKADGVVHLGYHHDFSQMAEAAQLDRRAIETFGEVLAGIGRSARGRRGRARARAPAGWRPNATGPIPRCTPAWPPARSCWRLADRGVRTAWSGSRRPSTDEGDHGFHRHAGRAWPAAPASPGTSTTAATAGPPCIGSTPPSSSRLAVRSAPAGSVLHAVAETGVPTRDIAEAIGRSVGVPAQSIPAAAAPRSTSAGSAASSAWIPPRRTR